MIDDDFVMVCECGMGDEMGVEMDVVRGGDVFLLKYGVGRGGTT